MLIPSNYSEQEVIDIIDNIANRLCYKFKFGYHTADDMKQEARVFAWQGLEKYDGERPLENFLSVHLSNRLKNFVRDNYFTRDEEDKANNNSNPSQISSQVSQDCESSHAEDEENITESNAMYASSSLFFFTLIP